MPVREVAEHAAVSVAASAHEHLGPAVLTSVSRDLAETDPKRPVVLLYESTTPRHDVTASRRRDVTKQWNGKVP